MLSKVSLNKYYLSRQKCEDTYKVVYVFCTIQRFRLKVESTEPRNDSAKRGHLCYFSEDRTFGTLIDSI
mgnify:CR=1 FL=1